MAEGLETLVPGPAHGGFDLGGQRQLGHPWGDDARDDGVAGVGDAGSQAGGDDLFLPLDGALGQDEGGEVGQRPGREGLRQPLGDLGGDEVKFGAQGAAGQAEFGETVGDGGEAAHGFDAGDGGFAAGRLEAAADEEDGVARGDEEGGRADGVGVVEDVAGMEEKGGVYVGCGQAGGQVSQTGIDGSLRVSESANQRIARPQMANRKTANRKIGKSANRKAGRVYHRVVGREVGLYAR